MKGVRGLSHFSVSAHLFKDVFVVLELLLIVSFY